MSLLGTHLHLLNLHFSLPQRANLKQGSATLDNNMTLFQSGFFFCPQNKKYNSVSSSISQNMMNGQSRNIYIFCRIFLMSRILPESSHSSCVHSYYSWTEITAVTFSLFTVIWLVFLPACTENKKVHRAKYTLHFS